MSCDADQAGAAAQRSLPSQAHGPRHSRTPANDDDVTKIAFVCVSRPRRQGTGERVARHRAHPARDSIPTLDRDTKIREAKSAGVTGTLAQKQAGFQPDERDRSVRRHRHAHHGAGIAMDAGGDIERKDGRRNAC